MSEQNQEGLDLNESLHRTEKYVQDNKKSLSIIGGAVLLVILAYFGYRQFIVKPAEEEARKEMFMAEKYFGKDSLQLALKGDGNYMGFEDLAANFSSSKAGNLSQYYLGLTLLKKGEYQNAIDALKSYDAEDDITGALALGAIAGAYLELGNTDEALSYYKKASDWDKNNFTRPFFLQRAGMVAEMKNDYAAALRFYEQIKKDYPQSTEARDIEKYIGRAEALSAK